MSKYNDLIKKQDSRARRKNISELAKIQNKSIDESLRLNELILLEIKNILETKGKKYNATKGHSGVYRLGDCYSNAADLMNKYDYVEGYAVSKSSLHKIAHAWNVDFNGNHIDYTLTDPEEYDYVGVVIPKSLVYKVGLRRGGVWFSTLSFLDDSELKLLK